MDLKEYYPESHPFELRPKIEPCEFVAASPADPSTTYLVAFPEPRCSCPGFKDRKNKRLTDIERYCEHLRKVIAVNGFFLHPYANALLFEVFRVPHVFYNDSLSAAFGFTYGKEWINVYTYAEDGTTGRFGYSLTERRWSYKIEPRESSAIVQFIEKAFPCGDRFYEAQSEADPRTHIPAVRRINLAAESLDVKEAFTELYHMANSIIEDDAIDGGELIQIKTFASRFGVFKDNPELKPFFELIQRIAEDGVIDDNEYYELLGSLREIARQIP